MQKEKLLFLFHFRVRVSSAKPKLRKVESKTKKLVFFFCRDGVISPSLMAEIRKNERNAKRKAAFSFSFPSTEDSYLFAWLVQEVRRSKSSFSVSLRKRQSRATESREQNKKNPFSEQRIERMQPFLTAFLFYRAPLSRICNPTIPNISICNAREELQIPILNAASRCEASPNYVLA